MAYLTVKTTVHSVNADQEDLDSDGVGSACDDDETLPEAGSEMMAGEMTAGEMTAGDDCR